MNPSIEKELTGFIRIWVILGPAMLLIAIGMALFSWPDVWFAWLMLFLALVFGGFIHQHTRMARKAIKLLKHAHPIDCRIEIRKETGEGRDYISGVVWQDESVQWHVPFTPPGWDINPILNKNLHAKAYFEMGTGCPLIVLIDGNFLWAERIPKKTNPPKPTG